MIGMILIGIGLYMLAGLVVDILIHLTHPIMYWNLGHALISHALLIVLWPLVLFNWIMR